MLRSIAAIAAIAAIGTTSCGDDEPRGLIATPEARDASGSLDAARVAAVDIGAWGCGPREHVGSGSFIADDLVVTAAHVVAGSNELRVIDGDGKETAGAVVHFDPDLDVAVVRTVDAIGRPLELRGSEAEAGEHGVLGLLRRTVDDGELDVEAEVIDVEVLRTARINTTDIYRDAEVQRAGFELSADVAPGDSGAVVVLAGGGVGIVWSRSNQVDDRAWAVDLPRVVLDPAERAQLPDRVDTGSCIDHADR